MRRFSDSKSGDGDGASSYADWEPGGVFVGDAVGLGLYCNMEFWTNRKIETETFIGASNLKELSMT